MALSGSASKGFARHSLIIEWSATQSISNNNSTVTAKVFLRSNDGYGAMDAPTKNNGSVTVNGVTKAFEASSQLAANQKKLLTIQTFTIPHESDGRKSFAFSVTYNVNVTFAGVFYGNQTASGTGELDRIARSSSFSINKATADFGTSITLTITKSDASFQHRIVAMFAGDSKVVSEKTAASTVSWTLPNEWMNRIPNGVSSPMAFYVETYSGNTLVGTSSSKSISAVIPVSIKPSISSIAGVEKDGKILGLNLGSNKYVQGKSIIRVSIATNIAYAATISSYRITLRSGATVLNTWIHDGNIFDVYFDNYSYLYGEPTIDYEAIDSRGRSAKASLTINLLSYTRPQIISFDAIRIVDGTQLSVTKKISATRIDGNKSHYEVKVWSRPIGGVYELKHQQSNGNTEKITITGFDLNKSYEVILQVIDFFGEDQRAESGIKVTTLAVLLDLYKDLGVGFGKMHEDLGSVMDVEGRINTNRTGLYQSGFHYEDLPNGNAYVANYWKSFLVYGHSWFFYNPQRSTVANMLSGAQIISCWTDTGTVFIQSQSISDGRLAFMRVSGDTIVQPWKAPY